jgi:hypothetical protein
MAGDLRCRRRVAVRKELAAPAADFGTPAVLWSLLVGELAIGSLLFLSDRLPQVLVRSLQLFLRF